MPATEADFDAMIESQDFDEPIVENNNARYAEVQKQAGDIPLMLDPSIDTVNLPRGLYRDGVFHTEVEVKELNGADEEVLAKFGTKSPMDWFDTILRLGVTRIGSVLLTDFPSAEQIVMLDTLLTGERQIVYLAIIAATFGVEKEMGGPCQRCSEKIEFTLNVMEDFTRTIPDGCTQRIHEYTTTKGVKLGVRLANGEDEREYLRAPTVAEKKSALLQRIVVEVDGHAVPDPVGLVRGLGMRDRDGLLEVMDRYQPQIDMDVELDCPACATTNTFSIGFADLFRA